MQKPIYNKAITYWLLSGALLILTMVLIGGITRLTGSGLSIVQWNLVRGTLPPLSDAAWAEVFGQYKRFPEYQKLNMGMTLSGFKQIFWWEYLHRLLGRLIGVVFLVPFLYFLLTRQLTSWLFKRLLVILTLGMAQGLMGWLMVKSGLVDNPHVSHFRLAAHLSLALALIGLILWTAADLTAAGKRKERQTDGNLRKLGLLVLGLISLQIVLGAFVAGLKAGLYYNTYPLMGGDFYPTHLKGYLTWQTMWENGAAMQFLHRWVAILVLLGVLLLWFRVRTAQTSYTTQALAGLLLLNCLVQVLLGIATLLLAVPVSLGILHQVMAVLLFSVGLLLVHRLGNGKTRHRAPATLTQQQQRLKTATPS